MTKDEFKKLIGEDPEDLLGPDWENYIEEFMEDSEYFHEGHPRGGCPICKMD